MTLLNTIYTRTSEIILTALAAQTRIKEDAICNPKIYFSTIHRLVSSVLTLVAHSQLNMLKSNSKDIESIFKTVESKLLEGSVLINNFRNLTRTEMAALEQFNEWFQSIPHEPIDLSDLYELLLLLEFTVKDGKLEAASDQPDSIGSFYTPSSLADTIVEHTLRRYIFQNTGIENFGTGIHTAAQLETIKELIAESTFADFSCGTGSFLLAILRYCECHLHVPKQFLNHVALNFRAIEADALSLEIAKLRVMEMVENPFLYKELDSHFIHGNPLIAPNDDYPSFSFCHEFHYHKAMAVRVENVPVCDVVVGNPPWGNVGFDLPHYLHLLCPRLTELEDENEFDQELDDLLTSHPELSHWLLNHDEAIDLAMEDIYNDDRFAHSTMGGLQTNLLFTELCNDHCSERGTVGLVLKASTVSDPINRRLWNHLQKQQRLVARYDLLNCNGIFNVGRTEEFSIVLLGANTSSEHLHHSGIIHLSELN